MKSVSREIYLDANATTRVLPGAATAAKDAMEGFFGNPSSSHITGLRARAILESTRSLARSVIGAESGRIIFTSGATEAIQTAVFSALVSVRESRARTTDGSGPSRVLLYGATEHKAVPEALAHWNAILNIGAEVLAIPVEKSGQLDFAFLREHAARADMICTMAVNNETGVIHDLLGIEEIVRAVNREVAWMVDYVQAVGKLDLDLSKTTISYAPVSGHKLYAPKGIGFLYVREDAALAPLFAGGSQESGSRSGTENLPGVAAMAAVFEHLEDREDTTFKDMKTLTAFRERVAASLTKAFPDIQFNNPFSSSVPTTINFSVKGFSSKEILDLFDAADIRVSSGSACGSAIRGSYVLDAMGLPKWRSEGAVRLSFGLATEADEIDLACRRIEEAGKALRNSCLIVSDDRGMIASPRQDGLVQLKKGSMCSWILIDSATRNCVIIDPFEELADRIECMVRCQNGRVLAVLDTHLHVDHDSCREQLIHDLGDFAAASAHSNDILGWPETADGTVTIGDGSQAAFLRISADEILVQTDLPGHTMVGRCFLVGCPREDGTLGPADIRFAFSGDTLLIGGIGRTDFSASSAAALYESLRRIPRLISPSTLVCPTHDYNNGFATTLEAETRLNPFLARIVDDEFPLPFEDFAREKAALDLGIDDEANSELVCGFIDTVRQPSSSVDVHPHQLPEFFAQHKGALVVDVREPHEYQFVGNWSPLGLGDPPANVPLTRFNNFLVELLAADRADAGREIIFLCRSGNRSGKAAEVLRRLGFENTWHIAGGIAIGGHRRQPSEDEFEFEYAI